MARKNDEVIKALMAGDFALGGELNPEQFAKFETVIRAGQGMIPAIRFETKTNPKGEINKLQVGEPISRSADENTSASATSKPKFGKVEYATNKIRSDWHITHEALKANIEQEGLEDRVMEAFMTRIATDYELLAIQGDATTYAAVDTPQGWLLRRDDGWDLQTEGANVVDVGGAEISFDVFRRMYARLADHYKADPGLRWILSKTIASDWMAVIAGRATGAGDAAMAGAEISPLGIPMLQVPLIPNSKSVDIAAATYAQHIGTRQGDFEIVAGTNDTIKVDIDNGGADTVTLTPGLRTPGQICADINTEVGKFVAYADGRGRVVIQSTTTGGTSEVDIQAVANDAYTTLGLTVGVYTGADAGSGSVNEGSFLWLANPKNFIFILLDAIRVTSKYNQDFDRFEAVAYSELDMIIENIDAIVKGINVHVGVV